jgi:hypothetical protein
VLSVVSGETDMPVEGATVIIAGRSYVTDAAGHVTLATSAPGGTAVDVTAPPFLDRKTSLRSPTETRFTLWPRRSPTFLNEDFTAQIVYTAATPDALYSQAPLSRLRPEVAAVAIVPSTELRADPDALSWHQRGVDALTTATAGRIRYFVADSAAGAAVTFETRVAPAECSFGILGFARIARSGNEIVGGEIVYCSEQAARSAVVVHELGHTFGLNHTSSAMDVMVAVAFQQQATSFSPREALVMNLMLQRRAGNRFPDDERAAGASGGVTSIRIDCP